MKRILIGLVVLLMCCWLSQAQQAGSANTSGSVPSLINYSGVLKDDAGKTLTSVTAVTFLIYDDEQTGSPAWMETQNVKPDSSGHYTVQLGATTSSGLPADLFQSGEARWLAIQIAGEQEQQPRVLLVAVPYAMKAADAQTLGGLPASAFLLAPSANTANSSAAAGTDETAGPAPAGSNTSSDVTTTGGTVNTIPLFKTATSIQNSLLTQTGTTAINVKGALNLPALGTATSSAGFNSQPQNFVASSFNSSTSAAENQTFRWQAEPTANDTTSPSGTLNLLYGLGATSPTQTGLSIASNGQITFATGQTFPGTGDGTITGVTGGTGLSGSGTSGNVTLNNTGVLSLTAGTGITVGSGQSPSVAINTSVVPQLSTANIFTGNQTVNGNLSATGVVTGSGFQIGSNLFDYGSYANSNAFTGFAGNTTMSGPSNTASGVSALGSNTTGELNTAFGVAALYYNTTGSGNVGVGDSAGRTADSSNGTGSNNTFLGANAILSTGTLTNATAIGANAEVAASNALVLGSINGVNSAMASTNVGIGTTAPSHLLEVDASVTTAQIAMVSSGTDAAISVNNTASGGREYWIDSGSGLAGIGAGNFAVYDRTAGITRLAINSNGNVGIGTTSPAYLLDVRGTGNFTGLVTFASGQTFPGTGTITGVMGGTGLSGSGTSGTVTLNNTGVLSLTSGAGITVGTGQTPSVAINTSVVPQLSAANTFTNNQTVSGNLTATGVVSGSSYQIGSNLFGFGSYANSSAFLGFAGNPANAPLGDAGVGYEALAKDTASGGFNAAIGYEALYSNQTGNGNAAIGDEALYNNTTGSYNTGVGVAAGTTVDFSDVTGNNNTFLGAFAGVSTGTLTNVTAVGAYSSVGESNALVLGCVSGQNNCPAAVNVGIGTTAPGAPLEIDGSTQEDLWIKAPESGPGAGIDLFTTGSGGLQWEILNTGATAGQGANKLNIRNITTAKDVFTIEGGGNVGIGVTSPSHLLQMSDGAYESGGTWTNASDRNLKEGFASVDGAALLAKLNAIPMQTWKYKTEKPSIRHLGPMAQDFRAAFGLGDDDKHISTIDEGGVALAAVQQLYREGLKKDATIRDLQAQIRAQQTQIGQLTRQVREVQVVLKASGGAKSAVHKVKAEVQAVPR